MNLQDLVESLSKRATEDPEAVQNAVKNIVFTEATRKSYCYDKRAGTGRSVFGPSQCQLVYDRTRP